MTHGSLFSGIGGFDLAARNCGIENIFQVEIDEFCQKVLTKNFPETQKFRDIKEFNGEQFKGKIDIISGGFPCQPFSIAGQRKGKEDERYLWEEMLRVISEVEPKWVIAENVSGLLSIENGLVFEQVLSQMESIGYEVQPFVIPACAKNAPHRRDRIWIVANNMQSNKRGHGGTIFGKEKDLRRHDECDLSSGFYKASQVNTNTNGKHSKEHLTGNKLPIASRTLSPGRNIYDTAWDRSWHDVATELCRVDDGLPKKLDRVNRVKALGNAIVPQIAETIFTAILEVEYDRI